MPSGTSLFGVPQSGMLQVLVLFTCGTATSARAIPRAKDESVVTNAVGALALAVSIPHPNFNCPECGQGNGESGAASAILLPLPDHEASPTKRINSDGDSSCESSSHMTAEVVNSQGDVMEISTDDDACDPSTSISFSHSAQRTPGSVLHAVVSGDSESTSRIIVTLRTNTTVQPNVTLPGDSEETPTATTLHDERASTGTEGVASSSTSIADLPSSLKPSTTAANQTEPVAGPLQNSAQAPHAAGSMTPAAVAIGTLGVMEALLLLVIVFAWYRYTRRYRRSAGHSPTVQESDGIYAGSMKRPDLIKSMRAASRLSLDAETPRSSLCISEPASFSDSASALSSLAGRSTSDTTPRQSTERLSPAVPVSVAPSHPSSPSPVVPAHYPDSTLADTRSKGHVCAPMPDDVPPPRYDATMYN
ncbi:hypothetical protein C8Q74DRAFT_486626 [Fomes fomentarius]|nr:hypothetical protein C8Q74DRAFT_486626 [Fomes fomentarius]